MNRNEHYLRNEFFFRYIPQKGDRVIGIVTSAHGETFKIDIGSADIAFISFLSFEGLILCFFLNFIFNFTAFQAYLIQ